MDDLRAAGLDAARKRVAPAPGAAAEDVRAWRSSWPQRLGAGDRRGALPPRPPPPRRGEGGGAGKAENDAGGAGTGRGGGGGGGAARISVVARAGPSAEADAKGGDAGAANVLPGCGDGGAARVLAVAPREGVSGGGELVAGSKKRALAFASSSAAAQRAFPLPKRRIVYAVRRFPPGCGRDAGAGSRVVTAAPARPGGGSAASPTKPAAAAAAAARHPPRSVRDAGSGGVLEKASAAVDGPRVVAAPARRSGGCAASPMKPAAAPPCSVGVAASGRVLKKAPAAVVPCPIADAVRHGPHAAALKPLDPSRRSVVAAAEDGLLGTDSQGCSGSGGHGSGKVVVRLLPKPWMISAIRHFPPGCGRVTASQPLNESTDNSPKTESKDSSTASGSFAPKKRLIVKGRDHLRLEAKSADKFPKTESKDSSSASSSFGTKKKLIVKGPDHLRLKVASACTMGSITKVDDLVAAILADDAFLKAEAAYQRKLQLKLNGSSDARSKVKMICGRFKFICRAMVQFVEQRSLKISRIDIAAGKVIKELSGFTQQGPVIGDVPGVEVGDEFVYRVELALIGLHRPHQPGIDCTKDENGVLFAISIVASGGYPGELSSSGELIYTGSGGKNAGKKSDEDQKLEGGNLALKNCIKTMTPVRVIHGFKGSSSKEEGSHSRAKGASAFTYDGLYHVVDYWKEGQPGSKVFKYKLLRIPGQPELLQARKLGCSPCKRKAADASKFFVDHESC